MPSDFPVPGTDDLRSLFGDLDIYLFDQLLRGRITSRMRILDAGCGRGRNTQYLMRSGAQVHAIDADERAVRGFRTWAGQRGLDAARGRIVLGSLDQLPYASGRFDAVVCSAVLHFAADEAQFTRMLDEMWRVLAPGGVFFSRLASTIGIEALVTHRSGRRYGLPDGSERFLVDEDLLGQQMERLGAELLDPLKTTVVQRLRSMTTWVLLKPAGGARAERGSGR